MGRRDLVRSPDRVSRRLGGYGKALEFRQQRGFDALYRGKQLDEHNDT